MKARIWKIQPLIMSENFQFISKNKIIYYEYFARICFCICFLNMDHIVIEREWHI